MSDERASGETRDERSGAPAPGWAVDLTPKALWADARDWLYPPVCLACGADAAETGGFCGPCWREAHLLDAEVCPQCGSPAGAGLDPVEARALARSDPAGRICPSCPSRRMRWRRVRAAALYAGSARRLVLTLKGGDRSDVARWMGALMAPAARALSDGADPPPLLVPTPLHWRRRLSRGFNQAGALARAVSRATGLPVAEGLARRVAAVPKLAGLDAPARAAAIADAFAATRRARSALAGRAVLLVDDVMTTGATLDAAALPLLEAGAARVDGLVFARADAPPGRRKASS